MLQSRSYKTREGYSNASSKKYTYKTLKSIIKQAKIKI